jgi:hypothetical protein
MHMYGLAEVTRADHAARAGSTATIPLLTRRPPDPPKGA